MFYLLLWGTYPTVHQRIQLSRTLVERMQQVPGEVFKAIRGLPYVFSQVWIMQPF